MLTGKLEEMLPVIRQVNEQVQPLTFFFLFLVKIIDLPEVKINEPLLRKYFSLLFLQETPLSSSLTLEGLF